MIFTDSTHTYILQITEIRDYIQFALRETRKTKNENEWTGKLSKKDATNWDPKHTMLCFYHECLGCAYCVQW